MEVFLLLIDSVLIYLFIPFSLKINPFYIYQYFGLILFIIFRIFGIDQYLIIVLIKVNIWNFHFKAI